MYSTYSTYIYVLVHTVACQIMHDSICSINFYCNNMCPYWTCSVRPPRWRFGSRVRDTIGRAHRHNGLLGARRVHWGRIPEHVERVRVGEQDHNQQQLRQSRRAAAPSRARHEHALYYASKGSYFFDNLLYCRILSDCTGTVLVGFWLPFSMHAYLFTSTVAIKRTVRVKFILYEYCTIMILL